MFDSINRMEGTSIDWSPRPDTKKQAPQEGDVTTLTNNRQAEKHLSFITPNESKDQLMKELEKVNSQFQALNHSLRMKFNEEAEQFYVEVVDIRSKEVLETIPAEHVLELAAKLKDMVGFFIDEKR